MDGFFPTIFDPVLFSIQDFDAFYKERMTLVCPTKDILRLRKRIVWIQEVHSHAFNVISSTPNVLYTALSVNIPHKVLSPHIWCEKLVPPNKDFW